MSQAVYPANVNPGDTGHAQYHNDQKADVVDHKASLHPQVLDDLTDVVASGTPPTGGSGIVFLKYDVVGGNWNWDTLPSDKITVRDSGTNALYTRSKLNIFAGTGAITDDAPNDQVTVNVAPADVRVLRVAAGSPRTVTSNNSGALASMLNLVDLSFVVPAGAAYDFEGYIQAQSTAAAGIRALVAGPSSATMAYTLTGPALAQTSYDVTGYRDTTVQIPTNGSQQFGGFPSGTLGWSYFEIKGGYVSNPGTSDITVTIRVNQANSTTDVLTIAPLISKLVISRAS